MKVAKVHGCRAEDTRPQFFKAAPAAGFFYPAVSSERDFINGDATPARRLGPLARPAR